ncbi:MAG: type II secretion system protein GspG [Maricaulis sp.]|jgi:general secretion pathway protein G|nr:type II secretion system protein GspG [Maricaulis sp.]HAQ35285.1 type II secretion system protein GspG [Alphaproteobacteria bacterium]|tara:strand:+ start:265 stop:699 length:435 start_codon:yes stop_codon:yes gene_type:complete
MKRTQKPHGKSGYTLAELLVVMVILALLAAIATPLVLNQLNNARHQSAATQVENFATALSYYRLGVGRFPDASQGLQALITQPSGTTGWSGPYLDANRGIPDDPWDRPYIYEVVGPGQVVIRTLGRDGQEGGDGEDADIVRTVQ